IYAGDATGQETLESLWHDLRSDDVTKAYRAIGTLANRPKESVPFLQKRVRPKVPAMPEVVARLLGDLDSESFAIREDATRKLLPRADLARPALEKVRANPPSAEVAQRVSRILRSLSVPPPPEETRALRSVAVLELIGGSEALRLLENLSKGAPGAFLTTEAE